MNAIPPGIRPESARNPVHVPADSALNTANTANTANPLASSRGMALVDGKEGRDEEWMSDLARIVCSIRPDWTWAATKAAIRTDDRPWRTVVLAAINGAADPDIRHPNGLRYVNATGKGAPTPTPPRYDRRIPCSCPDCVEGTR